MTLVVNAKGRLNKITDLSGSTAWSYNHLGQVTQKTQTIGSVALTTSYTYNAAGQLLTMTYPSGKVLSVGYDIDRPTSLSVDGSTILSSASYDPFGPANGWTWGYGANTSGVLISVDYQRR